nr:MAG: major capsid protein [Army ant associated microvirus 3]
MRLRIGVLVKKDLGRCRVKLNSVMRSGGHFSRAPQATVPRSAFNRTSGHKTTFNAGYLVPVYLDEVLPGDTFNLRMTAFSRLATPIHPIMDNMTMETFFFFVPCRLVWSNWQAFCGERENPDSSTDYLIPSLVDAPDGYVELSLYDYFGLPTKVKALKKINALPLRCYNLIWNEYFRDQNMQKSLPVSKGDGPDALDANYVLQRRGKRYDYFTSCLPWPQKGPSVELPLGKDASLVPIDRDISMKTFEESLPRPVDLTNGLGIHYFGLRGSAQTSPSSALRWVDPALKVDLSTATSATINQLRQSFQIQKMYERDARGGTRYIEILQSHFGVVSPDSRLQRPEYLGGGSSPVIITPIAQTSAVTEQPSPLANLAAIGTCVLRGHGFTKSFVEHGYVIGLVSVRADLTYQRGVDKLWSRKTRFDFYWPAFAHLGEQSVLNKEIYAQGTADDDKVFGYQERFAEYRFKHSLITGKFRSNATGTLDSWHLSQDFKNLPTLSSDFIVENPPVERIVSVTADPHFIFDSEFKLKCARPMPAYSVPGFVDHF